MTPTLSSDSALLNRERIQVTRKVRPGRDTLLIRKLGRQETLEVFQTSLSAEMDRLLDEVRRGVEISTEKLSEN